jgi:hypothetical protein
VLAGIGWVSRLSSGGIEDHYLFSLQSSLESQLQPHFRPIATPIQVLDILPGDVHSVSVYRFENPLATWQLLGTTLSSQLDTLSAVLVTSLLKSALTPYGIDDPKRFLNLVGPELSTVRLTAETDQSTLIAQVRDEASLRQLLLGSGTGSQKLESVGDAEIIELPDKMLAVSFYKARVLIGPPADLRLHLQAATGSPGTGRVEKLEYFLNRSNSANVVTFTRDSDGVMEFVQAISRAGGAPSPVQSSELSLKIEQLPYSATETTLSDHGLVRITRSSFGQFATLLPLVFPER